MLADTIDAAIARSPGHDDRDEASRLQKALTQPLERRRAQPEKPIEEWILPILRADGSLIDFACCWSRIVAYSCRPNFTPIASSTRPAFTDLIERAELRGDCLDVRSGESRAPLREVQSPWPSGVRPPILPR